MSTQTKQKDAVYEAVVSVTGITNGKVTLTKDQVNTVATTIATGLTTGTVAFKGATPPDAKTASSYARTLLKNWLTRDTRLNGGVKHTATPKTSSLGKAGYSDDVQAALES